MRTERDEDRGEQFEKQAGRRARKRKEKNEGMRIGKEREECEKK